MSDWRSVGIRCRTARAGSIAASATASSAVFVPPSVFSACAVFEPSR